MTSDGARPTVTKRRPIPIFTGAETPAHWDEIEAMQVQAGEEASKWLLDKRRPSAAAADLDWDAAGFEPRWIGDETASCVAALDPSIFHQQGADEFARFRAGAQARDETAVVVSIIGSLEPSTTYNVFGDDALLSLPGQQGHIRGRRLGRGAQVKLADEVSGADKDLALRLLGRGPDATWWELSLGGTELWSGGTAEREYYPPEGHLVPLVVSEVGGIAAGVWQSADGMERRYIVPAGTPWRLVLDWLRDRGLPELVPGAMRRSRDEIALSEGFLTHGEVEAQQRLDELDAEYEVTRAGAVEALGRARGAANDLRYRLLFGTGVDLVGAVSDALRSTGVDVVDVDELVGDTASADLLCTWRNKRCLIEVKSSNGPASERMYDALVSHVREWPELGHGTIDRAALVVNHEVKSEPDQRSARPFTREAWVRAQEHPVVTSIDLLHAWRTDAWDQVLLDLFGESEDPVTSRAFASSDGGAPGSTATTSDPVGRHTATPIIDPTVDGSKPPEKHKEARGRFLRRRGRK